jgi:hypothetical protein
VAGITVDPDHLCAKNRAYGSIEYNGGSSHNNSIAHGRVENDMLPFFAWYLVFEVHASSE